jgi:hypothetical protein
MPVNEYFREVPSEVAETAGKLKCLGGVKYVYPDGEYGGKCPVASIGCNRATRFQSTNYQNYMIALGAGWVAFRSPSGSVGVDLPPAEGVEPTEAPEPLGGSNVAAVLALLRSTPYVPDEDPWTRGLGELGQRRIHSSCKSVQLRSPSRAA